MIHTVPDLAFDGPRVESEFPKPLSYKDELTKAMEFLAQDPLVRFVGYGVKIGGRAGGTLKNIPDWQLVETPVAENLMAGAAATSLLGFKPVVFFERFDFVLNAMDGIVNHLDKMNPLSHGEFKPTMILRIVVGNSRKPLFTGKTHTQDFSVALRALVSFPVVQLQDAGMIVPMYKATRDNFEQHSSALIEYKDLM